MPLISLSFLPPAKADAVDPLAVDFFLNLAGDDLVEAATAAADDAVGADEILIGAIPLRLGVEDGDGGWRMAAGANGRYRLDLGGGLSVTSRARLTTMSFVDDTAADKAVAVASSDFRYTHGKWAFGLQPGLEVTHWDTDSLQRDMIVEGRASLAVADGLSLATTGRYRWREATGDAAADGEIASGRVGVVCALPHDARMEMALIARQEFGIDTVTSVGPSLALALPLDETIDLSANYGFTETTRHAAGAAPDGETSGRHHLGMAMTWDVGGDDAEIDLSAAYSVEHDDAHAAQDRLQHAGTVSLALRF